MNKKVYNGQTTIKTQLTKFVFAIAYLALTFVAMTFVDSTGSISNDGVITNIFRAFLASFGINNLNIVYATWNVFFIAFALLVAGVFVFLALPLIFKSAYKKAINGKFFKKFIIDLILAIVILAIVLPVMDNIALRLYTVVLGRFGSGKIMTNSIITQIANYCAYPSGLGHVLAYITCGMSIAFKTLSKKQT